MRKRIASLALILCLLLTTLASGTQVLAEESVQPTVEQAIESEFVEDSMEEIPDEETLTPAEDVPADEEIPPVEEEPSIEEDPSLEEEPSGEQVPSVEEEPTDEEEPPVEEPPIDDELIQEIDLSTYPALGSSGEQYAGVHYLSLAAYNSMPEDSKSVYVAMVDCLESMLDEGFIVTNVVFSLNSNGDVSLTMSMPPRQIAEYALYSLEELPDMAVDPESVQELAEEVDELDVVEELPEQISEPVTIIAENVELAESLMPEKVQVSIDNPLPMYITGEYYFPEAQILNTLFWKNKDNFSKQLNSTQKKIYNLAYDAMIENGDNSFVWESNYNPTNNEKTLQQRLLAIVKNVFIATSALQNTYPSNFDYINWGDNSSAVGQFSVSSKNRIVIDFTFNKWRGWSQSLENQAKDKVSSLVNSAYDYAKKNYPDDITYGMIYYFDDWICKNNYYNNVGTYDKLYGMTDEYYFCHCSYGTLLKGYGVCESYALTMSRLLDAAGIPNLYVTGDTPGGGHAWNYVQMPNTKFYLHDSTWNDNTMPGHNTTREYLLTKNDSDHMATGQRWGTYDKYGKFHPHNRFKFATISKSAFKPNEKDSLVMSKTNVYLTKGKSETLATYGDYYKNYNIKWSNRDDSVATLKNGKITAKKPGKTVVTETYNGKTYKCNVYVYEFTGLGFADNNGKSSYTLNYTGGINKSASVSIAVKQKTSDATAAAIREGKDLAAPTYSIDKKGKSVVDNVSASLVGNNIQLMFIPRKLGNATITVKFAGKSAKLKLQVRDSLQGSWFSLKSTSATYTGKAIKPAVELTGSAPDGLKSGKDYSVSYENNINVSGVHKAIIKGKGNYGGQIEKTFTINKASFDPDKVKITDAKPQTYDGKVKTAKPTVKLGKKTLKADVDYEIRYNGKANKPTNAGEYILTFVGLNYNGSLSDGKEHKFTIKE